MPHEPRVGCGLRRTRFGLHGVKTQRRANGRAPATRFWRRGCAGRVEALISPPDAKEATVEVMDSELWPPS
jgi:hypothetical protein